MHFPWNTAVPVHSFIRVLCTRSKMRLFKIEFLGIVKSVEYIAQNRKLKLFMMKLETVNQCRNYQLSFVERVHFEEKIHHTTRPLAGTWWLTVSYIHCLMKPKRMSIFKVTKSSLHILWHSKTRGEKHCVARHVCGFPNQISLLANLFEMVFSTNISRWAAPCRFIQCAFWRASRNLLQTCRAIPGWNAWILDFQ